MLEIDKTILNISNVICNNIQSGTDRGLLSQNILSQLRNLVEWTSVKVYLKAFNGSDLCEYKLICSSLKYIKTLDKYNFLYKFHDLLQISSSHYTENKDGSERLMLKYYTYLLKIKQFLKDEYNLDILYNINDFPINTDTELQEYYKKIVDRIIIPSPKYYLDSNKGRYYIHKIKPFLIDKTVFYEVTFTEVNSNISKFDRKIAFTKHEIPDYYSVRFSMHHDVIKMLDKEMDILIIDTFEVSIRPCEFNNFAKLIGINTQIKSKSKEYIGLMNYLSTSKQSLTDLVSSDQEYYDSIKVKITSSAYQIKFFGILDICRDNIVNNKNGSNVLRYLLQKMNNAIIKD